MNKSIQKNKFNIANILFGLSGLILLGYFVISFLPITNDAIVSQNVLSVNSPINGVIESITVVDGQRINKNTALLTIKPTQANSEYLDALAKRQQANMDVSLIEQQIKVLQLDLTMANDELVRLKDDYAVHKSEHNIDSKLINQLAHSIKIQQSQINKVKQQIIVTQVELDKARLTLSEIDKNREQALLNSHEVVIKAISDGFTQNTTLESGVKVVEGQKLFDFVDASQTMIKANFAETDLRKVRAGSKVLIFPRAYLGLKVFHGVVVADDALQINSNANSTNQNITANAWLKQPERLPVMIKVLDSDNNYRLLSGMSAYVYVQD